MAGLQKKLCAHKRAVMTVEDMKERGKEKRMPKDEKANITKHGYSFDEVTSALQKEIRLGNEENAFYWALELYEVAYYYVWKRLLIIASEDVGMAAPGVVQQVIALSQGWEMAKKTSFYVDPQSVVMAVMLLCRSPKSTEVDDAKNLILNRMKRGVRLEMPGYALDAHTKRGRENGETEKSWYETRNGMIGSNPYREKLIAENPDLFAKQMGLEEAQGHWG